MSTTLSTIDPPAVRKRMHRSIRRLVLGWVDDAARFFLYRAAVKSLRKLDDRELRDIGLERSQIDAAVLGFVTLHNRATGM